MIFCPVRLPFGGAVFGHTQKQGKRSKQSFFRNPGILANRKKAVKASAT